MSSESFGYQGITLRYTDSSSLSPHSLSHSSSHFSSCSHLDLCLDPRLYLDTSISTFASICLHLPPELSLPSQPIWTMNGPEEVLNLVLSLLGAPSKHCES